MYPKQREQFFEVYDSIKGQYKVAAYETIKRELPEYAKRIVRIGKRLGGGSLYTVYEVEFIADHTDYPERAGQVMKEAVRVLNPNALFHARNALDIIRDTMDELIAKDPHYAKAKPLVDVLEQWIEQEIADPSYEEDDTQFYNKWNGQKPSGSWNTKIVVPRLIRTGTTLIRREELIVEAKTFKNIKLVPVQKSSAFFIESLCAGEKSPCLNLSCLRFNN